MTVSHEEALNLLLANNCGQMSDLDRKLYKNEYMERYGISAEDMDNENLRVFELDLHCSAAEVVAELVSVVGTIQFRIISVKIV